MQSRWLGSALPSVLSQSGGGGPIPHPCPDLGVQQGTPWIRMLNRRL